MAIPVAPPDTCRQLQEEADAVVCLRTPEPFIGVGLWYEDFSQTSDAQVVAILEEASRSDAARAAASGRRPSPPAREGYIGRA